MMIKKIMKMIRYLTFFIFFGLISCKNENIDVAQQAIDCNDRIELSNFISSQFELGNYIFPFTGLNYSLQTKYYLFHNYNLIDYVYYYPEAQDSCFTELIKTNLVKYQLDFHEIKTELDSINRSEQMEFLERVKKEDYSPDKFFDGFYDGNNSSRLTKPHPIDEQKFQRVMDSLSGNEITKYWIDIDSVGNIMNIQSYKGRREKIDINLFQQIKWFPAVRKDNNLKIKSRMLW
jgi:hypothetical protein